MLDAKKALAIAQQYTDDSLAGAGAVAGVPCQIQSITEITGGNQITFLWEDNNGVSHTQTLNVMDGEKGDQGDKGDVGERGATGSQGLAGTIRVGSVTSGESPAVTNVGTDNNAVFNFVLAKGDRGERGEKGADGQDGKSFDIKAQFPTYEALIAAHPTGEAGDAYFVGTDDNPDLYIWLTDDAEWFNNGKIAGVKGDKGDTGEPGFSPIASVAKVGKVATITIRDKTGQTTASVSDGEDGQNAQFETLPAASATNEGMICQYVGETSGSFKNGHFYKCVEESGSFYWVELFGSSVDKDATDKVAPNNHALVESNAVYSAINNALSSIYTPRGDLTCAELTASLLVAANVGNVYEMSDAGTTSNLFLQGAGVPIAIGDNVGIIQTGADTYKFNLMANAFDLTDYQKKELTTPLTIGGVEETEVEGALGALNGVDATKQPKDLATPITIGGESRTTVETALGALQSAKQDQTLATPLTIGGVQKTTVEDALGGLNGLVSSGTTSSNKLVNKSGLDDYMLQSRTRTNDVLADALNISTPTILEGSGTAYTGTVPYSALKYAIFLVIPRGGDRFVIGWINGAIAVNNYNSTVWNGWSLHEAPTSSVTSGGTAPVTSGGVWTAIQNPTQWKGVVVTSENDTKTTFFQKIVNKFGDGVSGDWITIADNGAKFGYAAGIMVCRSDRLQGMLVPHWTTSGARIYFINCRRTTGADATLRYVDFTSTTEVTF